MKTHMYILVHIYQSHCDQQFHFKQGSRRSRIDLCCDVRKRQVSGALVTDMTTKSRLYYYYINYI